MRISWIRKCSFVGCSLLLIYLLYYADFNLLFSALNSFVDFCFLFVCLTCFVCFCLFVYLFTSCKWLVKGRGPRTHQASESTHWRCDRLNYGHCRGTTGMYRKNIHTAEKRSINLIADSIGFHLIVTKQRVETAKPLNWWWLVNWETVSLIYDCFNGREVFSGEGGGGATRMIKRNWETGIKDNIPLHLDYCITQSLPC